MMKTPLISLVICGLLAGCAQGPYVADRPAVDGRAVATGAGIGVGALLLVGFLGAAVLAKAASDAIDKG